MAIGDALGAAVEFKSPGSFKPVTNYRDGGPHGLEPGEWTDDTSMALALADSITVTGWDLNDQARRYVAWQTKGEYSVNGRCFDIGITVNSALAKFGQTNDARTSAIQNYNDVPVSIRMNLDREERLILRWLATPKEVTTNQLNIELGARSRVWVVRQDN